LGRSEKLAGIGTLAAGVAHEINNPLASVAGCAEGLIDRLDNLDFKTNDDREVFPDYLDTIYNETYRCKLIISKLLDFSRQKPPVFSKIDINTLVSDVVKTVGRQTDSKKVDVLLTLSSTPPTVWGDDNQLKQVFTNFISNASDAIQHEGSIWVSITSSNDSVQITFKDTGYGIASENINKIFEPFFTTKEPGKGTGLGLAICYGIIEDHEGKISVDSKGIGHGTTFTISLPIHNEK
jgi:signal transduction histidine kinase